MLYCKKKGVRAMKLARLTPYSGQMTAAYYRGAIPHYNAY